MNRSRWAPFLLVSSWALAVSPPRIVPREPFYFEQVAGLAPSYVAQSRDSVVKLGVGEIQFAAESSAPIRMQLAGGGRLGVPEGLSLLPGLIHRMVQAPSSWRRNERRYLRVRYRDVYPGIDLVFHGETDRLEYDFVVAPGADPSRIQVRWDGAKKLIQKEAGVLAVSAGDGREMRWNAPVLYQDVDGKRVSVDGRYLLAGSNRTRFSIGTYDRTRPLVIDPALQFSTYLGGASYDMARAVASDSSGNVYIAGASKSMDLPVTKGAFQTAYAGGTFDLASGDCFVAKYSAAGALIYLTYLGGAKDDIALAIAVDSSGNAYITGYTNSTDFPISTGAFQSRYAGSGGNFAATLGDAFVTKLSPDGSAIVYSTYLGGSADDVGLGIALDGAGNVFVTGTTLSSNYPLTSGAYQTANKGSGGQAIQPVFGTFAFLAGDAFVTKLDAAGAKLLYSTFLGGHGDDCAFAIAVDGSGNAIIGGYTLSSDFPVSAAAQSAAHGREVQNQFFNFGDAFVAKFDPSGANLIFSTYLGGSGDDQVSAIALDGTGNIYLTGSTSSLDFPVTPGVFQKNLHVFSPLPFYIDFLFGDAFMTKLSPAGAILISTYLGGSGDEVGHGIAVDGSGNILVTGNTASSDFPVTQDAIQKVFAGPATSSYGNVQGDGFFAVLNPSASAETFATFFGGTLDDVFMGMALSPNGTAQLVGATASTNFPLLHAAQGTRGGASTTGVSRADVMLVSISGFSPSSAGGSLPQITSVVNATGETASISQNTWIEIKGNNLVPATTPAAGVIWSSAPEFKNGLMPTQLGGVSVNVNGKPAFIYFYCSAKTSSACATDQVNVLTPLDSTTGTVQVQLTSANGTASATAQMQSYAPGFFQFNGGPFIAATHLNGSLIGPASLYPGLSTPAAVGETIVLYLNGFGQTTPAVVNGSSTQTGALPSKPVVTIANTPASVQFAGVIAPGLYQFNIVVPAVFSGDNLITATYNGFTTQTGAKLTVQ